MQRTENSIRFRGFTRRYEVSSVYISIITFAFYINSIQVISQIFLHFMIIFNRKFSKTVSNKPIIQNLLKVAVQWLERRNNLLFLLSSSNSLLLFFFLFLQMFILLICSAYKFKHIVQSKCCIRFDLVGIVQIAYKFISHTKSIPIWIEFNKWSEIIDCF